MGTDEIMVITTQQRSRHQNIDSYNPTRHNTTVKQQSQMITSLSSSSSSNDRYRSMTKRSSTSSRHMTQISRFISRNNMPLSSLFVAFCLLGAATTSALASGDAADSAAAKQELAQPAATSGIRSTQPTVERQVDTPNSVASPVVVSQAPAKELPAAEQTARKSSGGQSSSNKAVAASSSSGNNKPAAKQHPTGSGSHKRLTQSAAAVSHKHYDMYQLKAHNSHHSTTPLVPEPSTSGQPLASSTAANGDSSASHSDTASKSSSVQSSDELSSSSVDKNKVASGNLAYKKLGGGSGNLQGANSKPSASGKLSSFSLLKKFLPSFMTSAAGPVAAAAAAASAAVADKHYNHHHHHSSPHSRSSSSHHTVSGDGPLSKVSGKIINLLSSSSKKSGATGYGLVPDHAPFFTRKPSIDRQAGSFASSLLSNPLGLGLLFSAPLIPSLLLTPLAIAGLSPAMSAINNFFGDDEETSTPAAPGGGPLSQVLAGGSSSPLASILNQASGNSASSSAPASFALQAMQTFLGTPSTTEKPLFNPGMFASQGIQNAMGSLGSAVANAATSGSSSSSSSSSSSGSSAGGSSSASQSPLRSFLGGNSLIQTAASMISPSFAAPPSSSSSSSSGGNSNSATTSSADDSDGPGLMQVASDVFDKMAKYMSPDRDSISQASSVSSATATTNQAATGNSSPLSTLVGLSSYSPFQLSSLFASSPLASAIAPGSSSSHGHSHGHGSTHRAGFFSTLKNVYELFSSSFLRRQEVGDSNECQQRLICELHQRAMNSKLFRRSVQSNLMELANLDKSLQEQISAGHPLEARVDADTKALLSDFLKATNNFASGRELVNCGKMFPRCSTPKLLSAANAHLTDPVTGKSIGKFSSLMKKMRFKSAQQHQSQWKLRNKPSKQINVQPAATSAAASLQSQSQSQSQLQPQYQATDYLQVAPLSVVPPSNVASAAKGQLTPADSLKMVQQIMLMSQQQQQLQSQQQQQQQMPQAYTVSDSQLIAAATAAQQQQVPIQQQSFSNSAPQQAVSYQNYAQQYPPQAPIQQQQQQQVSGQLTSSLYTDAVPLARYNSGSSTTDSPYFAMQPSSQQQPQASADLQVSQSQLQSNQAPMMQQQQQSVSQQLYNNYPQQQQLQLQYSTSIPAEHMSSASSYGSNGLAVVADKKVTALPSSGNGSLSKSMTTAAFAA